MSEPRGEYQPLVCDCGVGQAMLGERRKHYYGCSLFIKDTPEWRAANAALSDRCPGCDLPLSVNDWCPRCLKFAADFGSSKADRE